MAGKLHYHSVLHLMVVPPCCGIPMVAMPPPDTLHCASLAGVSRSTTILVAYLMTVTELGWERCLAATKAVRSYASPNFGFQQQLQEYEQTLLKEVGPACTQTTLHMLFITWGGFAFCVHACKSLTSA